MDSYPPEVLSGDRRTDPVCQTPDEKISRLDHLVFPWIFGTGFSRKRVKPALGISTGSANTDAEMIEIMPMHCADPMTFRGGVGMQ